MKTHKSEPKQFDGITPIMLIDCGSVRNRNKLLKCAQAVNYDYIIHVSQLMLIPVDLNWDTDPETGNQTISTFSAMEQMRNSTEPITKKNYRASFCVKEKDLETTLADLKGKGFETEIIKVHNN